jgi:hypothetical protein
MKRKILPIIILTSPLLFSNGSAFNDTRLFETPIVLTSKEIKAVPSVDVESKFINALIQVESRGRDSIIGDKHLVGNEAVGALQIRPIMVREVNRILKIKKSDKRFKLKDRFSREKSIEMFMIWKNYHHSDDEFETIARNWNGGPKGYKSSRTEKYWVKVQQELDI